MTSARLAKVKIQKNDHERVDIVNNSQCKIRGQRADEFQNRIVGILEARVDER